MLIYLFNLHLLPCVSILCVRCLCHLHFLKVIVCIHSFQSLCYGIIKQCISKNPNLFISVSCILQLSISHTSTVSIICKCFVFLSIVKHFQEKSQLISVTTLITKNVYMKHNYPNTIFI